MPGASTDSASSSISETSDGTGPVSLSSHRTETSVPRRRTCSDVPCRRAGLSRASALSRGVLARERYPVSRRALPSSVRTATRTASEGWSEAVAASSSRRASR